MNHATPAERVRLAARSLLAQVRADCALRGIRCAPDDNAPDTFEHLCSVLSDRPGDPVPVYPDHSGTSVFGREGNLLFRAWHDMEHFTRRIPFGFRGELTIEPFGAARIVGSDAKLLHRIEIVGQTLYYVRHGTYPTDQSAFTVHAFKHGIRASVERGGF